jgi:two-component system LytT family response regulator
MNRLRILIAEDEDLARTRLARLIRDRAELELVRACRNGGEALAALTSEQIDIALLDIEMPKPDGIFLSRQLCESAEPAPVFVFITAHARFAVDAFGVKAADYLLKPYDEVQLDKALAAAKERLQMQQALIQRDRIRALMNDRDVQVPAPEAEQRTEARGRVMVRHNGRMHLIRADQVDWIEAEGRKCILHCGTSKHQVDGPLSDVVRRLGEAAFLQLGRSSVVNIDSISELQEMFKGDLVAVLKNGDEVAISRRLRTRVLGRLNGR